MPDVEFEPMEIEVEADVGPVRYEGGAAPVIVDSELDLESSNPVENRAIAEALNGKGTYSKPSGGIPKTDLASAVQTSLEKADTALQTAPVKSVNGQTGDVTVQSATDQQVATAASTWLSENVDPETGYVIDTSLSVSNAAADAKATGDKISELKSALDDISTTAWSDNMFDYTTATNGVRLQSNGATYSSSRYFTSDYIDVSYVGDAKLYLTSFNNGTASNMSFWYACWYDANKNCISYSSTVEAVKANNTDAKYFRFSGTLDGSYSASELVLSNTSRPTEYSAYVSPYKTIFDDTMLDYVKRVSADILVLFGYSGHGQNVPEMSYNASGNLTVFVNGFLYVIDRTNAKTINIQTYNTTAETFIIQNAKSLVFNTSTNTLSVVENSTVDDYLNYIPLITVDTNGIPYGGQWLPYLLYFSANRRFKTPRLPYSPRHITMTQNSNAGDQAMCIIGDWLVCWNALDSDGLVHILNKTTKEQIKLMTQTLGHGGDMSYNAEHDALMLSSSDGTYIMNGVTDFIENNTIFTAVDFIVVPNKKLGVFGAVDTESYAVNKVGPYDTRNNVTITAYTLGITDGEYDGNYTEGKTYTAGYALPVLQDCMFFNGYIYKAFGYRNAGVYKIALSDNTTEYEVVEAYNVPSTIASLLEAEGLYIDGDMITISARDYNNTANKYFIEMTM